MYTKSFKPFKLHLQFANIDCVIFYRRRSCGSVKMDNFKNSNQKYVCFHPSWKNIQT